MTSGPGAQPVQIHDAYGFKLDCTTAELEIRHQNDLAAKQQSTKWDKLRAKKEQHSGDLRSKDPKLKKFCRAVRKSTSAFHSSCACHSQESQLWEAYS